MAINRATEFLLLLQISFYSTLSKTRKQLVLCNIINFNIINNLLYNQVVDHLLVFCEDKNGDKKKNEEEKYYKQFII